MPDKDALKPMKILKSFFIIINFKAFLVSILAVISTAICQYYGFTADFPLTLVGIAIVFPIVFSIDSAYKRRESALEHFAELKSNGISLYYASRDWLKDEKDDPFPGMVRTDLKDVMAAIQRFLSKYFLTD